MHFIIFVYQLLHTEGESLDVELVQFFWMNWTVMGLSLHYQTVTYMPQLVFIHVIMIIQKMQEFNVKVHRTTIL